MEAQFVPYAPPGAVLKVIRHYRERDVPERISTTSLMQIGVTESLVSRTVAALKFLDLIREDGTTTDVFRALRFATAEDYQDVVGRMIDAAYKGVLEHINVATATDREISNAFIPYSPGGQRGRMITLFLALCREAGWEVAASAPPKPPTRRDSKTPTKRAPASRETESRRDVQPTQTATDTPVGSPSSFAVTDADFAVLPEDQFDTVWNALGLIQKARARAAKERGSEKAPEDGQ